MGKPSILQVDLLFKEVDTHGNGKLDFQGFLRMFAT